MTIITPKPSIQFEYKSSKLWNSIYIKVLTKPDYDLRTKLSSFKKELKALLLQQQNLGETVEWQLSNFML